MRFSLILFLGMLLPRAGALGAADHADNRAPAPRPELSMVLLNPAAVWSENLPDGEVFSAWLAPALDACRAALAAEKKPPALLVQITLRKHADPVFELAGRPALPGAMQKRLRAAFAALPPLRPPVCDVALRLQTVEAGAEPMARGATFKPRLLTPDEAADAAFAKANLAAKVVALRAWAREQALPLLAHAAANVDAKIAGVRSCGQLVATLDFSAPIVVEKVFYGNPDFWRGALEMRPGNQLIGALPALAFAANGELDKASSMAAVISQFSMEDTLASTVLIRLRRMLDAFRGQVAAEINRGIAFHDRGQFDRAIATYQTLLKSYPGSAWAHYEVFFSTLSKTGPVRKAGGAGVESSEWDAAAPEIYRRDPLYNVQFSGIRGRSMGAMFDRLTLRFMAGKPTEDLGERLGTIAEVAMHLESYGPAAQIYWVLLNTKFAPKKRILPAKEVSLLTSNDVLARFLYCLEQLGVTTIKDNFQGDFPEAFAELDRELAAWRTQ